MGTPMQGRAGPATTAKAASAGPIASAELLAVGAELLIGDTRDTNSGDVAAALTELGVEIQRMSQLPDDLEVVTAAIRSALKRADLVITTGGLGPTPDDLTRESIAAALGVEPTVDAGLEAWLRDIWARRDLPFSDTNLKQAWLIPGASALPNPHGTAPGWWVEVGSQVVIALPGPPRELHPMWEEEVLPRLRRRGLGVDRASETLRLTGIGESALVDVIGAGPLHAGNPRMATYARADSVDVRISADAEGDRGAQQILEAAVGALSPRLDPYVFARGDRGWPDAIGDRIAGRDLATAEAGTGGYLGTLIGTAPWLILAKQLRSASVSEGPADPEVLANDVLSESGASMALAVVADETADDMRVRVATIIDGHSEHDEVSVFRGGDAGRRRAANAALAQLWRRLRA